jgi:N-acetylmuramoyl-L-alanine amidase
VWDDDNQPRFIEDDFDDQQNLGSSKQTGKPSKPNADQPDQSQNGKKSRDAGGGRNERQDRMDRRAARAARAERMAKAAREQPAHEQSLTPPVNNSVNGIENDKNAGSATPESVTPSPAELPASDIFMEIMKRAAATNASREERRRESEARRAAKPSEPTARPAKPAPPTSSDLPLTPPDETDDRPLWQQVRDYTPPTPLERALASLSSFATDETVETPKEELAPSSEPSQNSDFVDQVSIAPDDEVVENKRSYEEIDVEAEPPVIDPAVVRRRAARTSLAQSLAEVMIEQEAEEAEDLSDETLEAAADEAVVPVGEPLPKQPLTDDERVAAAKLEAQRVRRIKKRQQERRQRRVSVLSGVVRSFLVVIPSALLMATILSWWTDPQFLRPEMRHNIQSAIIAEGATPIPPTPFPTPNWARLIGIVSGHSGPGQTVGYDPGAVCEDIESLNEHDINMQTAIQVVRKLRERGYVVDLLDEFDPRLVDYQAAALVSIHANTCQDFGETVSGFLVAKAEARPEASVDSELAECIAKYYSNTTQLERRFGLTEDMTDYHTFREIDVDTPAAIIELGFMRADRDILNDQPDVMAEGIVQGIMCFLEPQLDTLPDPTMTPTP